MSEAIEWIQFFFLGWGSFFLAYVFLQVIFLISLRRVWCYLSLLPIPFMLWLLYATMSAYYAHSNMWPMAMIFVSPLVALLVTVFGVVGLKFQTHPRGCAISLASLAILLAASVPYVRMYIMYR
jgi:hypothetical protein